MADIAKILTAGAKLIAPSIDNMAPAVLHSAPITANAQNGFNLFGAVKGFVEEHRFSAAALAASLEIASLKGNQRILEAILKEAPPNQVVQQITQATVQPTFLSASRTIH